ncbi:5-formyltetrahydrofolate cyclo-ligase [Bacillus sp. REN16]|uniref:5-formyltetrahydrofolate cyclo-ligase n=1 Tax=Bacillus sp. REN16 TaxID=2887296 RepID=UPI001E3AD0F7|nr:5-formyltetrahydrofolate cyclo-ligase [Bacillus sp. REN16]MCC3356722.1 5-formyltetrahydrofolate cyclo-ligase [Bacillus sp. REN16]
MKTKQDMRKDMKETLRSIEKATLHKWSRDITEQVLSLPEWVNAKTIGITISGELEVNTKYLIEKAWETNKRVAVPKCHPKTKSMTFREITSFSQLEVVYYGLKEPIEDETQEVLHNEMDVLFVPGLSFVANGYRLGHGGGYYDRYLMEYQGNTVSLAFQDQLVNEIPVEPFDIPVQKIVTNTKVIETHD